MYSKPRAGARPRSSHPHAMGLRHCFLFNEGGGTRTRDCVGNLVLDFVGAQTTWAANEWGTSIKISSSSNGLKISTQSGAAFGRWNSWPREQNRSWAIVAGVSQVSGNQAGFRTIYAAGQAGLYLNTGKVQWYSTTTSRQTISPDVMHTISASSTGPNTGVATASGEITYHIDGRLDCENNWTDWDATPWTVGSNIVGNDSFNDCLIGQLGFLYVYDRHISDGNQSVGAYDLNPTGGRGEMNWLHQDPFAMFSPGIKYFVMGANIANVKVATGDIKFQKPALSGTGTVVTNVIGSAAITFQKPSLSATGSFASLSVGTAAITFQKPSFAAEGTAFEFTQDIVTQIPVEWIGITDPTAIVTQIPVEWVGETTPNAAVTQVPIEWLGTKATVKAKITQVAVEAVFGFVQCAAEIPPGVYDFDQCTDWPSDPIVPGTDPLVGPS